MKDKINTDKEILEKLADYYLEKYLNIFKRLIL